MKKRKTNPIFINFILVMIVFGIPFLFAAYFDGLVKLELLIMGEHLFTGGEGIELSKFILIIFYIFLVLIPASYGMIFTILSSIALCIYKPRGKRLFVYRVLMGIVYLGIALLAYIILALFGENLFFNIILAVIEVGLFFILGVNIWNTYSSRIRESNQ